MTATVTAEELVTVLRAHRFRHATEDELQEGIAAALISGGFEVEREVRLGARERIDVLVGTVGIEVKIAGDGRAVERQLARYAEHACIDELVLVTSRARHRPPDEIGGKPVHVVSLIGAGL